MSDSSHNPNQAILDYLHNYCEKDREYDFAVMLRGKWGAGKTYLVREVFVAQREEQGFAKNLFVSLYGVNSFRQIDQEFYRQLHPILSSKGMRLATALAKGLIRTTVKVDLDHDGKEDLSVNSTLPDVDWGDYFKSPGECLLIFDDLERCPMPLMKFLDTSTSWSNTKSFV